MVSPAHGSHGHAEFGAHPAIAWKTKWNADLSAPSRWLALKVARTFRKPGPAQKVEFVASCHAGRKRPPVIQLKRVA